MKTTIQNPNKQNITHRLLYGRLRFVLWGLWMVAVVCIGVSFAVRRTWVLDYNPINGDFQSYNVFRRMLDGHFPYSGFANYIGMAPVYINLPFMFANQSFAGSLFATNFTCNILFSMVLLVIFWLVTQNTPVSLLVSAVFSKLVSSGLVGWLLGARFGGYFTALYQNLFTPSNSMRVARLFWPFLLVLLFLVFNKWWQRRHNANYPLLDAPRRPVFSAFLGLVVGFGVTWSNDFGLSVIFAVSLLMLLLFFFGDSAGKSALHWYALALLIGGFASAFLCTGGTPRAFFDAITGTGGAQYYYFNGTGGRALIPYIFSNIRLLLYTAPYVVLLVFCLVRLIQKKLTTRLLLGGFLAISVLAATYAYVLSGSGYNFTEALEGCFWLAVLAFAIRAVLWLLRRRAKAVGLAAAGALAAFALFAGGLAARDARSSPVPPENAIYNEILGGYAPYPKALGDAAELLGGQPVFSLYATGLEAVTGRFQPSGYDYVIHALGDKAQHEYLGNFLTGQHTFAQTTTLGVEGWLAGENWYVYRYIVADYRPVLQTEYSLIWQRIGEQNPHVDAEIAIQQKGDYWHITVTAPEEQSFIADVRISYEISFTSAGGAVLSLGRSAAAVTVPDVYNPSTPVGYYLPAQSRGVYIPIAVENGVGTAILAPADATVSKMILHNAILENTLPPIVPML